MSNAVKMTAPVSGGGDSKKLETELIPAGFQICTLYGMASIGSHEIGKHGFKNRLMLSFEFPKQLREFYEGDGMKPCSSFMEVTHSMHENAALRARVHEMDRTLTNAEASEYDISSLLNQTFVAFMEHTKSKDGTKTYSNIKTLQKLDAQTRLMFGLAEGQEIERINTPFFFYSGSQSYESDNFKNLPNWLREKNKASKEGKAHALAGGVFAEPETKNSSNGAAAPEKRKLVMLVTDFTYEQYSENWTDEQLVANGKAKWEENKPAGAPAPQSAPSGPPSPAGPSAPNTPPAKPAEAPLGIHEQMVDGKRFSLTDKSWDLKAMISQGWTIESLVAEGHGNFQ